MAHRCGPDGDELMANAAHSPLLTVQPPLSLSLRRGDGSEGRQICARFVPEMAADSALAVPVPAPFHPLPGLRGPGPLPHGATVRSTAQVCR